MKNTFMDHKTFMAFLVKKEKQMREVLGALGILKN